MPGPVVVRGPRPFQGAAVSASGVRGVWQRHGLETRFKRLLRLEEHARGNTLVLTEQQIQPLERHSTEFRCRHVEASRPGELLNQDTFHWGTLKGVGKVYVQVVIDVFCSLAAASIYNSKMPINACDLLYDRVLPFYEALGVSVGAVLTDNGREFCGKADSHPYELLTALEGIEHRTTKVRSPRTNGFAERMNRTLLDECFRVAGRTTWYENTEQIQADLDRFIEYYNRERSHQGYPPPRANACPGPQGSAKHPGDPSLNLADRGPRGGSTTGGVTIISKGQVSEKYWTCTSLLTHRNSLAYLKLSMIAQLSSSIILRLKPQCPPCSVMVSFIMGLRHISSIRSLMLENGMIRSSFDEIIRIGLLTLIISSLTIVNSARYDFTLPCLKCGNKLFIMSKGVSHFMHSEKLYVCGNASSFFLKLFFQRLKRCHLYKIVVFILSNASNGFKTGDTTAAPATVFIKEPLHSLSSLMIIFPPKEKPSKNILLLYNSATQSNTSCI